MVRYLGGNAKYAGNQGGNVENQGGNLGKAIKKNRNAMEMINSKSGGR